MWSPFGYFGHMVCGKGAFKKDLVLVSKMSEHQKRFNKCVLKLDEKYADYLGTVKQHLQDDDMSISSFISMVFDNGEQNLVFLNKKGVALPNYIRREILQLHNEIYGH